MEVNADDSPSPAPTPTLRRYRVNACEASAERGRDGVASGNSSNIGSLALYPPCDDGFYSQWGSDLRSALEGLTPSASTDIPSAHYLSEIVIRLRFAANSRPAFGPLRSISTPFSFFRLTPPAPPTNAPPAPTAL